MSGSHEIIREQQEKKMKSLRECHRKYREGIFGRLIYSQYSSNGVSNAPFI